MNFIIEKIKNDHILNEDEVSFLEMFSEDFLKNNQNYLNIDLSNPDVFSKYLALKKQENLFNNNEKLENVENAAALFIQYLKSKKRIILITDSDLDGTSCRAIATSVDLFLKRKFNYTYIFEQYFSVGHTHGICFSHVDSLLNGDIASDALIITADNGINNRQEVLLIKEKYPNVKIIITDHHIANEGDDVFDYVDHVLNPEAISLNTKSKITKLAFNNDDVKTSYSGAHTFYFLMKELLEQLNITDNELNREMLLVALFSDIGDIINFGPDVMSMFTQNIDYLKELSFIKNYMNKLDSFNQFPDENFDYKVPEYLSKVITMLNSTRRTNSILLQYSSSSENEFSKWLMDKFGFDTSSDLVVLNKKTNDTANILELMNDLNKKAKKIYEYFYSMNENKYNVPEKIHFSYSYIKEMPVLLLLSENLNKNKNDSYFLEEAYSIVNKMNLIKNAFRNFIVDNELYISDKFELFETYFSKKDGVLREILSIQAFIENNPSKSFLTLAQNQENVINGSLRSKSIDFKDLFNNHPKVQDLKDKYEMTIDIFGHSAAAGIFFNKTGITYPILFDFLSEFESILLSEGVILQEADIYQLNPESLLNIDVAKMIEIVKNYFIIGPNSFIKPFTVAISGEKMIDNFGDKLKILTSKTGTKYMNVRDNSGNVFLFFPKEEIEDFSDLKFITNVNFKYNSRSDSYFCEFLLDSI